MRMIQRSGEWLTTGVGEALMMMNIDRGNYVGMNPVGARIWELIETPRDLDDLCNQLLAEFEVDEAACRRDVTAFADKLCHHGLASERASSQA